MYYLSCISDIYSISKGDTTVTSIVWIKHDTDLPLRVFLGQHTFNMDVYQLILPTLNILNTCSLRAPGPDLRRYELKVGDYKVDLRLMDAIVIVRVASLILHPYLGQREKVEWIHSIKTPPEQTIEIALLQEPDLSHIWLTFLVQIWLLILLMTQKQCLGVGRCQKRRYHKFGSEIWRKKWSSFVS